MSTRLEIAPRPTVSVPSPLPTEPPSIAAEVSLRECRKRWTTAEFDRLLAAGFLDEGGPEYLWDGEIIVPMSEHPPHVNAVANLLRALIRSIPEDHWTINQGNPIELADGYKPQPDFSILKGPRARYRTRVPTPADIALIAEVSNTSYSKDFREFLRQYAAQAIPVYWIVNIDERRIEVYENPCPAAVPSATFATQTNYGLDEEVPLTLHAEQTPPAFVTVKVRDVLRDSLESYQEGKTP